MLRHFLLCTDSEKIQVSSEDQYQDVTIIKCITSQSLMANQCCKSFILEFHYSKLWFFHHNWKAFTYTPWLPYKWSYQAIYIAYRWMLVIFFFAWLVKSGVVADGPKYLTFLTYWGFITYNLYLLIAALSTTTKYLTVHFVCPGEAYNFSRSGDFKIKKPSGCCGYADNKLSWYQMIHWFFFVVGNELAFGILVLYWAVLSGAQDVKITDISLLTHLVNGLVAVIDLWVSGLPVNLLHAIYLMIYGSVYVLFSGIYFAITGDIIYEKVLDYGHHLGLAIGATLTVVMVIIPLLHTVVFYLQYLARFWILYWFFARCQPPADSSYQEIESVVEEATDMN